jgi:hypothetical protein
MLHLKPIIHRILEDYALPWQGTHGVGHWVRVLENGLRLAKDTKADVEVVQLFAIFHDAPKKLCTPAARTWDMIRWADGRAAFEVVPELVRADWGIE